MDTKQSWPLGDAAFGYMTDEGEVYPFQAINAESLLPTPDKQIVYAAEDMFDTSVTYTSQMTPQEMWSLRCVLEGWITEFIYRDGWNRRITG